jgi:hypothetical protein
MDIESCVCPRCKHVKYLDVEESACSVLVSDMDPESSGYWAHECGCDCGLQLGWENDE